MIHMNEMKHATEINDIQWRILRLLTEMFAHKTYHHDYDVGLTKAMEHLNKVKLSLVPDFHEQHKEMIE